MITMKPLIIIENDDLDSLSSNVLNLSLESNKQAFFKLDIKIDNFNKINKKRKLDNVYYDSNKKNKSFF